jgi:hypothetical protein
MLPNNGRQGSKDENLELQKQYYDDAWKELENLPFANLIDSKQYEWPHISKFIL